MKKFDYIIIIIVILAALVTFLVVKGKNKAISSLPVEAEQKIEFTVAIKGATISGDEDIIKEGENAFLTIRNVPYKELKVVSVERNRKQIVLSAGNEKQFIVTEDVSAPNQYDYLITLEDDAKITDDGAVVGGNKIKIGIPVVLENFKFKLGGVVSAISFDKE